MSLDSSPILSEFASNIRNRPIAWEANVRSNLISEAAVKRIKAVDKVPPSQRTDVVAGDEASYAQLVADVLKTASEKGRVDVVQYMLMWTGDLLADVPSFAQALLVLPNPYGQFLKLLKASEKPTQLLSAAVLTTSLATPNAPLNPALREFFTYLAGLACSQDHHLQDLAVQVYTALLRRGTEAKSMFWEMRDNTVAPLVGTLQSAAGGKGESEGGVPLQLLYHVLLVVWECTFEEDIAEEVNPTYDIIPPVTEILRGSIKEKVTRVCLAILSNLATKAADVNLPALLVTGVLPYLQQTLSVRFSADAADPDLVGDLQTLIQALEAFEAQQTTLSSYRLEVMSGHLRWSPPHRKEVFWKKHARDILDDKELVEKLAEILKTSEDKLSVAVAANDVGALVREVPYARKRWETLGAKARVMELMADSDAEVRYEALKAVQGFLQTAFSG